MPRMPTFAVPPVWLKSVVVLSAAVVSERPIWRNALPPPPEAAVMFRTPVPLRLKMPVALAFTPSMMPRVALVMVVMLPPLRL